MSLTPVRSIAELRRLLAPLRAGGAAIGCVPTMGALHAGHGRLIERARAECATVVVTVFVNPIQFNRSDDFERYPRTIEADLRFCEERGVDLVFAPDAAEMYPREQLAHVEVERLAEHLCGAFRPGHFRGVATVVAKLFNIVQPDRAYFGEKDAQQLAVIERMARDLNFPVTVVPVPTVREADGLAMSSRNARLSPAQRRSAAALYRALEAARESLIAGLAVEQAKSAAREALTGFPDIRVEYLEIVDAVEMQPLPQIAGAVRIAIAAWLGETRLIDNLLFEPR